MNRITPSIRVIACFHIALFLSLSSYRNNHVVFIVGCRGRPALLSGQQGNFGINEVPYRNMTCSCLASLSNCHGKCNQCKIWRRVQNVATVSISPQHHACVICTTLHCLPVRWRITHKMLCTTSRPNTSLPWLSNARRAANFDPPEAVPSHHHNLEQYGRRGFS